MEEGRKRALAIAAGILVARHLNTAVEKSAVGRNEICLYGSGIKFKRCHTGAVGAIQRRVGLDKVKATCRD
jgi:hypothetical protein